MTTPNAINYATYCQTGFSNYSCEFNADDSITSISSWRRIKQYSEDALQQAVAEVGPVSVAIDASPSTFKVCIATTANEQANETQGFFPSATGKCFPGPPDISHNLQHSSRLTCVGEANLGFLLLQHCTRPTTPMSDFIGTYQ